MNKLPTKQIYLLLVAIFGIVAISIYSTYAIFTLESRTDNIVSIRTPENLSVSSSIYEYKQVTVPKDSYITTDIDIYNNREYSVCYSIWYKALGDNIKVYQNTTESLTTNSTIEAVSSRRINLLIVNDNDTDTKVNFGISAMKNEGTCELNIANDRLSVSSTISAKSLSATIIKETEPTHDETGYLTYKDNSNEMTLSKEKTYYASQEFTYKDEEFTLKEPKVLYAEENDQTDYNGYYMCSNQDKCNHLYHITEVTKEDEYKVKKYDLMIGYLTGDNGLRKVDNDYYYYGDNPHNFIYYNCKSETDTKTCELWRIIGFKYDEESNKYLTKIVRNDYLETHIFDETKNVWDDSNVSKYLNKDYQMNDTKMIKEVKFKEENIVSFDINKKEIPLLDKEYKDKIMLLNVSDYLYTSSCDKANIAEYDSACFKNNWLNKDHNEWSMTTKYELPKKDEETEEEIVPANDTVYILGDSVTPNSIVDKLNIRPVVYLKTRVLLTGGNGTLDNPYIIR